MESLEKFQAIQSIINRLKSLYNIWYIIYSVIEPNDHVKMVIWLLFNLDNTDPWYIPYLLHLPVRYNID